MAPQASLRCCFLHPRFARGAELSTPGVRNGCSLGATLWSQKWGHRGNMLLHPSVTQKITQKWYQFLGSLCEPFFQFSVDPRSVESPTHGLKGVLEEMVGLMPPKHKMVTLGFH